MRTSRPVSSRTSRRAVCSGVSSPSGVPLGSDQVAPSRSRRRRPSSSSRPPGVRRRRMPPAEKARAVARPWGRSGTVPPQRSAGRRRQGRAGASARPGASRRSQVQAAHAGPDAAALVPTRGGSGLRAARRTAPSGSRPAAARAASGLRGPVREWPAGQRVRVAAAAGGRDEARPGEGHAESSSPPRCMARW